MGMLGYHWAAGDKERLADLWDQHHLSASDIGRIMGKTRNSILGMSRRLNLQFRSGNALTLGANHWAVQDGVSLFTDHTRAPERGLLKPGGFQRKLGDVVRKGHWKGMPIYSLTLEERATCPRSCKVWASCFGNGMHRAFRYRHGDDLEAVLSQELETLQGKHPSGFVVRLHILGDFYSIRYVDFWREALTAFPALRIFGYTAWQEGTEIGDAIANLRIARWRRFAVRTSGASDGPRTAVYTEMGRVPEDMIICPAQTNKTKCCATCALCWGTKRPIAFLKH